MDTCDIRFGPTHWKRQIFGELNPGCVKLKPTYLRAQNLTMSQSTVLSTVRRAWIRDLKASLSSTAWHILYISSVCHITKLLLLRLRLLLQSNELGLDGGLVGSRDCSFSSMLYYLKSPSIFATRSHYRAIT
jgi:hypothetical protein